MRGRTTPEVAETIALNALGYLAESPESLERLMNQSGLDSTTIRQRAAERDFLAAVLDFLMANEELLIDFCRDRQIDHQSVQMACHVLGGA
jgi:hypothetical protein